MEMGPCERSLPRSENMVLVRTDVRHIVSPALYSLLTQLLTRKFSLPSGGISTFGPLIIESFGFDQFKTILFNIPFGAVQLIATMGGAWMATALKMKGPVIVLLCLPSIAGCVMLLRIAHDVAHKAPLLAGYYIVSSHDVAYKKIIC